MKTIDVREGDEFSVSENGTINVKRDGWWQWFLYPRPCCRHNFTMPGDRKITAEQAIAAAEALGYRITRSDDAKPAATPPTVKENLTTEQVHQTWKAGIENNIRRLESRLASATDELGQWIKRVETNAELAETRLGTRLAAVEKPTQTGVVKVPWFKPTDDPNDEWDAGYRCADRKWRSALAAAGVKWEEGKQKNSAKWNQPLGRRK